MLINDTATFLSLWAKAIATVFAQTVPGPPDFKLVEKTEGEVNDPVRVSVAFSGAVRGSLTLKIDKPAISAMAATFIGETIQPYNPEHTETFLEIVRQSAGVVADELRPEYGEIAVEVTPIDSDVNTGAKDFGTIESCMMDVPVVVGLRLDASLAQSLPKLTAVSPAENKQAEARPMEARKANPDTDVNLDLIMDLELNVMINFGKRIMPLSEVLALGSGSVIELDHEVDEPVELMLDDKVIARGEVVIVEGNYGLRVTEFPPKTVMSGGVQ